MDKFVGMVTAKVEELHRHHVERKQDQAFWTAVARASSPGLRDDLLMAWQRNHFFR